MDAQLTEDDVRIAAEYLGYDLVTFPGAISLSVTMNAKGKLLLRARSN